MKQGRKKTLAIKILESELMEKSVLVIGGGIAGIQAALDLADKGVAVHLVEKTPSIGGRMAQLDKTFPTNDCSICILAPKMADCDAHPNINVMTYSEVKEVKGKVGDFTVKILKKARFIDESKCTGCCDCLAPCPVSLPNEFDMSMGNRKAIYLPFLQSVPRVATIDMQGVAACSEACPGGLSAQGYVALIREGKLKEAVEMIRNTVPLPSVCGRICHHPCEDACNRKEIDAPVAIAALKAFAGDFAKISGADKPPEITEKRQEKVAIVGAGPAGLTAAYRLVLKGFKVKIFEATQKPGGMLWWGIPSYRLPRDVLQSEADFILKTGAEIEYGKTVGKDITLDQLRKEYKAVFLAIGAHTSLKLNVEGENLTGVIHGIDFLRKVANGEKVQLGKKVAVIGGGNAAMDAARTALRIGSDVTILYRRTREEMPAIPSEVDAVLEEGIKIDFLVAPVKIIGAGGKVKGIECQKMKLGDPDKSGRRSPIPIEGSNFTIDTDNVIPAISQAPDMKLLGSGVPALTKWGTFEVNSDTLTTSIPGVFAGGDSVTGPASAIEAMAAGNKAAKFIEKYLKGEKLEADPKEPDRYVIKLEDVKARMKGQITKKERAHRAHLPLEKRKTTFEEVEKIFTKEEAIEEASRCVNCGPCSQCGQCIIACKREAIDFKMEDKLMEVKVGAIVVATGYDLWDPSVAPEYGYGKYPNVYTAMEYERMINASGPTHGHIQRRSDGKRPNRIAFIQCVGSRNPQLGHPYCSAVCCMFSLKESMLAREHYDDIQTTIFYKDLRTCSKNFFEYAERARNDYGVRTINSDGTVKEKTDTHNPIVVYDVGGRPVEEEFDIVVLANTLIPRKDSTEVAKMLGVKTDEFGFFTAVDKVMEPGVANVPGIYLAGYCAGPADIPESVAQGSSAAAKVMQDIAGGEG
jgi:heterodisulfide reductase subunit A-like polyferredoxin